MASAVDVEAARRSFLASGHGIPPAGGVRAEGLASWQRSRRHDVDRDRVTARLPGHLASAALATACAEDVFDDFFKVNGETEASLVLLDAAGVVRVRRDGEGPLARLLDGIRLVPGYDYSERAVGTTAASVALHERADVAIRGPEHYHGQLMFLSEAASLVAERHCQTSTAAALGVQHQSRETEFQLPLA